LDDVIMPVAEDAHEEGFSGWKIRSGVTFVQPPGSILRELLAARIHLDDSQPENGPLARHAQQARLPGHGHGLGREATAGGLVPSVAQPSQVSVRQS